MKLYHGSKTEIKEFSNSTLYLTTSIAIAREYVTSEIEGFERDVVEGFIYELEVSENEIEIENDFQAFDCAGYLNKDFYAKSVVLNPETNWVFVKNPSERVFKMIEKI